MAEIVGFRLLGTGLVLRLAAEQPGATVAAVAFVEIECDGEWQRWTSSATFATAMDLAATADPTTELIDFADQSKDLLTNLLAELRAAGHGVTRWEFYAAPCRIEIDDSLREELRPRWREHEPRPPVT